MCPESDFTVSRLGQLLHLHINMGFRVEPSLRIRRRTISCCCCSRRSRHSRHLQCLHLTCPNRLLPIRPDPPSSWPAPDVEPGVKRPSEGSTCRSK
ncbi:hypothetical protein ACE6H2_022825 [Prunus campanulata]